VTAARRHRQVGGPAPTSRAGWIMRLSQMRSNKLLRKLNDRGNVAEVDLLPPGVGGGGPQPGGGASALGFQLSDRSALDEFRDQCLQRNPVLGDLQDATDPPDRVLEHDARDDGGFVFFGRA
jgi:hypothetical protein